MALVRSKEKGKQPLEVGCSNLESLSLPLTILCDVCDGETEIDDVCLDLSGCTHLPCYSCLVLLTVDCDFDGVKCPVSSCMNGFLHQHHEQRENRRPPVILAYEPLQEKEEEKEGEEDEERFFCPICMEQKLKSASFRGKSLSCEHVFCKNCIAGHVQVKVEQKIFPIGCPDPDCHIGKVELEDCRRIIPVSIFDIWGLSLCEAAFPDAVKFYCPFPECSALLMNEGDEYGRPLTMCECLHCNRLLCAECRVPWHSGQTCQTYKREMEKEEGESSQFMELARSKKWQKCPRCGFYVERAEGCLYIRCRCCSNLKN